MKKPVMPTLVTTGIISLITLLIVTNGQKWSIFVPLAIGFGIVGLNLGDKLNEDKSLAPQRWFLVAVSVLFNVAVYAIASFVAVSRDDGGNLGPGLILLAFVIMPFYYGIAAIFALKLIKAR